MLVNNNQPPTTESTPGTDTPPLSFNPSTQSTAAAVSFLARIPPHHIARVRSFVLINWLRFTPRLNAPIHRRTIHNVPGCGYYFRICPLFIRMPQAADPVDHHQPRILITSSSSPRLPSKPKLFIIHHPLRAPIQ